MPEVKVTKRNVKTQRFANRNKKKKKKRSGSSLESHTMIHTLFYWATWCWTKTMPPNLPPTLPDVQTVSDCASLKHAVLPFLPDVKALPARLIEAGKDVETIKTVYLNTNPLVTVIVFALFMSVLFLVISETTRNNSQVDRAWSILPILYNGHYALWARMAGFSTKRLDNIAVITALWGVSSFYNCVLFHVVILITT